MLRFDLAAVLAAQLLTCQEGESNTMRNYSPVLPLGIKRTDLSADQLLMLRAIDNYDMWFVAERLERKKLIAPHRIAMAINEFKKYLALIALGHRGISMNSSEVDEVWHNFILFTYEYNRFCHDVIGEFVHHAPQTSQHQIRAENTEKFLIAYRGMFGAVHEIWFTIDDMTENEQARDHRWPEIKEIASGSRAMQSVNSLSSDCDSSCCGHVASDSQTWLSMVDCQEQEAEPALPPDSFCLPRSESDNSSKDEKEERKPLRRDESKDRSEERASLN
jgi:hypothetical protein